jgi:hypothetical protein
MATKKVIDMSSRVAGAAYNEYVYLTGASPDTDERWPAAYLRQFILDGITGGYGIDAVPAGNPAAANTTVDLVLDVSELTAAAGTADVTDYVVIEAASDNSTKKILIGSLPFVTAAVSDVASLSSNLTASPTTGDVKIDLATTLTGLTSVTSTGFTGALTGNADTATALETARTIGGTSFDGTAAIVPATITVADTTDTTAFVGLWESATGDLEPKTDAGITYNAATGMLTATGFTGPLTGNADTATALTGTLGVAGGGTGITTAAKGSVLAVNATDTISALSGVTDGDVLTYTLATDTIGWAAPGHATGTVTSVAISGTDGIDVDSGSPITTSGTITLGLSGIANSALTNSDVGYGGVTVALGASDATPAFDLVDSTNYEGSAIMSTGETVTTKFLRTDGDNTSSWQIPPDTNTTYTAGDGLDLTGTTFSTDLKVNSGLVIDTTELSLDLGATGITGTLAMGDGGTGLATIVKGSVLVANAIDTFSALSGVTDGHVLTYTSASDTVGWAAPAAAGDPAGTAVAMAIALGG